MELMQNLWERYGFTDNPYDTKALSLNKGAPLSVQDAYIPRADSATSADLLTNFLRNPGGGRIVVEGDPGVGKTTFVNYHRQKWANSTKHKLISPSLELEMQADWKESDFLISLLSSLTSKLRLEMDESTFGKNKLLREIVALTGVQIEDLGGFNASFNVLGTGFGGGRTKSTSIRVGEITNNQLRLLLRKLIVFVTEQKYAGVIFHLDNFDKLGVKEPKKLMEFFDTARDVLQEPNVYFIFVGNSSLFQQVIVPLPRVRSIFFDTPVSLQPLSLAEVKTVMDRRYELLSANKKRWIKPVKDDVVESLYDIFSGKIRYVMNAVTSLISHLPDSYAESVDIDFATHLLNRIAISEVKRLLHGEDENMFLHAAKLGRFTNVQLGSQTKKSKQSIQKYINKWLELNLISTSEKVGRNRFYEIDPRFAILKDDSK